ncbi:hypothetical protein LGT39_02855 [Demequina sp. TTPB684]|uniref:hypothetical protein n=1 Tax=unclassified Demequina TaxID=2620311 RepID=UPI001CF4707E|nr:MULTISPECIES: hypothetical protein [unclassified Demequina]MCB2411788.1 hypothetical protein [Demequina sp. TTPB684]UPU89017.1 hypothetical protein LGT36_003585 [Demequina sp. TMPB413]
MAEIGTAELTIIPSFKGGQREIERQLGGVDGRKAGAAAGVGFNAGLSRAIAPLAALGLGAKAFDIGRDSITAASDLGESLNAINVVYGDIAGEIAVQSSSAASNLGLAASDYNSLAVQFSNFVKTVAGEGGDVAKTLGDLTGRAADFASVMNLEVTESAGLFQSGLAGETEPLRRFGIDLSAAAVESYAYANGITNVGEKLTEAEKVQARYGSLMEQTNQTSGDFANTSGELANQQRILGAEWENLQAKLGAELLPAMSAATSWLVDTGLPAIETFLEDIDDPTTTIGALAESLGSLGESAGEVWEAIDGPLATGLEALMDELSAEIEYSADRLEEIANWISTDGVPALEGVIAGFEEGGWSETWDTWKTGAEIAAQDVWDTWTTGAEIAADNITTTDEWWGLWWGAGGKSQTDPKSNAAASDIGLSNVRIPGQNIVPPITATGEWGGAPIINIETVIASDTDDIVRQAEKSARTNKWAGTRGIDPRLTR